MFALRRKSFPVNDVIPLNSKEGTFFLNVNIIGCSIQSFFFFFINGLTSSHFSLDKGESMGTNILSFVSARVHRCILLMKPQSTNQTSYHIRIKTETSYLHDCRP